MIQLQKLGVKDASLLKKYLRDFEKYMKENYGLDVVKKGKSSPQKENPGDPLPR